jgi:microcystin-dependent protein
MPTNDFVPFATAGGANVLSQASYLASPQLGPGQQSGVASSALNNKALRQACFVASQVAQFMANTLNANVNDNGVAATFLAQLQQAFRPSGEITMWPVATAPNGWQLCDGSAISRTTYATLFAVIGTTFGIGDGSTTFNVPNHSGIFVRGAGSQTIAGITYSGTLAVVQGDQFQGHHHHLTVPTLNLTSGSSTGTFDAASGVNALQQSSDLVNNPSSDGINGTPRTGAETRPANISQYYIIKL